MDVRHHIMVTTVYNNQELRKVISSIWQHSEWTTTNWLG